MISASTASSKTGLPNMAGGSRSEFEPSKGSRHRPGSSSDLHEARQSEGVTPTSLSMSAWEQIADLSRTPRHVRKVPLSEVAADSIISSERTNEMGRLPIDYRSRSLLVCDTA